MGKTVFTTLLVRYLRGKGVPVGAVKPWCSGGREDARLLREALGGAADLDAINPWYFREALTPAIAARRKRTPLRRREALAFLRKARAGVEVLVIEGAGGLLSPLGEDFDARDLIEHLNAVPVVVAQNRLGAINQVRLVLAALGGRADQARVVLMNPARPGLVAQTNAEMLRKRVGAGRVFEFPFLPGARVPSRAVAARLESGVFRKLVT